MRLSRSTTQWHSLSWSQQRQKRLLDLRSPRISTWPLHLHGIAHTPGETLLPILSPSPHRTAPLIRDQLTLWNSFEQPPHPHSIPVTITIYYQISKLVVYLPCSARADPTTRQFLHCCLCRYPRGKGLPFTDRLFACGAIVLVE